MNRAAYHHGDLRAALVRDALEITRSGGPDALAIRDVTRRVGVSPNAAYRHFADRDALLSAVSAEILRRVAATMRQPRPRGGTARSRAVARLRAVGIGYIDFALTEPGWFQVVFFGHGASLPQDEDPPPPPFLALQAALDGLVEVEALTPAQREGAEWPCWATVHGFAELALHGPLQHLPRPQLLAQGRRAVDAIIAGLTAD